MLKKTVSILLLLGVISTASAAAFDRVIVFGDSLSDTGVHGDLSSGNNKWVHDVGSVGAPITNFDNEHEPGGAFLWDNDLVKDGAITNSHVLYPISAVKNDLQHKNLNYAYASAETGNNYVDDLGDHAYPPYVYCTAPGKGCVPGLRKQVNAYFSLQTADPKALYIIWAGGNDFFNNLAKFVVSHRTSGGFGKSMKMVGMMSTTLDVPATLSVKDKPYYSQPIANILRAVQRLHAAGVKPQHILVMGLPNIAKAPAAVEITKGSYLMQKVLATWIWRYNHDLNKAVRTDALFYDPSKMFDQMINAAPMADGTVFYYDGKATCYTAMKQQESACLHRQQPYVFYNGKHPTVAAGKYLAINIKNKLIKDN